MPWRCTCTTCAASSRPTSSRPCAAWDINSARASSMNSLRHTWSLRWRLAAAALVACAATPLVRLALEGSGKDKSLDSQLEAMTHAIVVLAEHQLAGKPAYRHPVLVPAEIGKEAGSGWHYQVWSSNGRLLLHSAGAPAHG